VAVKDVLLTGFCDSVTMVMLILIITIITFIIIIN